MLKHTRIKEPSIRYQEFLDIAEPVDSLSLLIRPLMPIDQVHYAKEEAGYY